MSAVEFANSLRRIGTLPSSKPFRFWWMILSVVGFAVVVLISQQALLTPVIAITGAVFLHEFGHYLCMRLFGYQNTSMYLIPFMGGLAGGTKHAAPAWQAATVSFAGPIPGLVLGATIWMFLPGEQVVVTPDKLPFHTLLLHDASMFLVFVNALNLLPFLPLDGGRIVQLLIGGKRIGLSIGFTIVSVLLIFTFTLMYHLWAGALFALLFLCTLPSKVRLARTVARVRSQLAGMDSELGNIRDEEAAILQEASKSMVSQEWIRISQDEKELDEQVLQTAKEVHESIVTQPLSRTFTALVLTVYVIGWCMPLLCSQFPRTVRYVTNYPAP